MKIGDQVIYDGIAQPENEVLATGESLVVTDPTFSEDRAMCKRERGGQMVVRKSLLTPINKKPKSKKLDDQELLDWAIYRIEACQKENFYGTLTLVYENGRIVRTDTKRTEIPS